MRSRAYREKESGTVAKRKRLEKECQRNEKEVVQGGQVGSEEECLGTEKERGTEA